MRIWGKSQLVILLRGPGGVNDYSEAELSGCPGCAQVLAGGHPCSASSADTRRPARLGQQDAQRHYASTAIAFEPQRSLESTLDFELERRDGNQLDLAPLPHDQQ